MYKVIPYWKIVPCAVYLILYLEHGCLSKTYIMVMMQLMFICNFSNGNETMEVFLTAVLIIMKQLVTSIVTMMMISIQTEICIKT